MNNTKLSLQTKAQTFKHYDSIKQSYRGTFIDRPLAIFLILLLLPCFLMNILIALISRKSIFSKLCKTDALSRQVSLHRFNCGLWTKSAVLFDICLGRISFCGIPLTHKLPANIQFCILNQIKCRAGIFSLYDLHRKTGLTVMNSSQLLEKQLNGKNSDYFTLIIKSIISLCLYGLTINKLKKTKFLPLFGLKINNTSMNEAVNWITDTVAENKLRHGNETQSHTTRLGFFVNVNSVNLSITDSNFFQQLTKANALFADGSGMRLAAKKAGFLLKGNNNGTDMLPHLCKRCIESNQSLYLFGALPGVAEKAADKLINQFPGLNIAGTNHGYKKDNNDEAIITKINNSGCDVLLVAMGSPLQEQWLLKYRDQLKCKTALAVGGLFDFYSGSISRSPMWLREMGMEWVWRLIQEPRNKFHRYVIGTPLFLYRTFFLGLVNTGVK